MTEKRKNYTAEFKREAVRLVSEQGDSMSKAARSLEEQEHQAFPGTGRLLPEQEELRRLREENQRLRMERDILKKTVTFFANESRGNTRLCLRIVRIGRWG